MQGGCLLIFGFFFDPSGIIKTRAHPNRLLIIRFLVWQAIFSQVYYSKINLCFLLINKCAESITALT